MNVPNHLRAVVAAGVAVLVVTTIAATRPPATLSGQPSLDRGRVAEVSFPYPHLLVVLQPTSDGQPDDARVILDDGSVAAPTQIIYQVPADGQPFQIGAPDPYGGEPSCDEDQICWGPTTVAPTLTVSIQLTYHGIPCTITGSPAKRTEIDCNEQSAN